MRNFYECLLVELSQNPTTKEHTFGQVITNASCQVCFKVDQYRSFLEISIRPPKSEDKRFVRIATLRFDAANIDGDNSSFHLMLKQEYENLIADDRKTHATDIHYRMLLKYHSLCTSGIFKEDCPSHLAHLRTYLRNNSMICVCIRGNSRTETQYQNLNAQLAADRKDPPTKAWYQANAKRPVIQRGQYLSAEDRPQMTAALDEVYTFFDWLDYMTRYGFGLIYEQEYLESVIDPFTEVRHEIFLFELAGGASRRIMFFLRMPDIDTDVRLLPYDKLQIFFDEGEHDQKKGWKAVVIEPLPYSPLATITGFVTRPWDKKAKDYLDKRELRMIPWQDLKSPKEALHQILTQQPYQVGVEIETSDQDFGRCISSLEQLNLKFAHDTVTPQQRQDLQYLLGNSFDTVPKTDMVRSHR
jgi:hypothetical protein